MKMCDFLKLILTVDVGKEKKKFFLGLETGVLQRWNLTAFFHNVCTKNR